MSTGQLLLAATLAWPLLMLLACTHRQIRSHMLSLLPLAPLPAIAAALVSVNEALPLFGQHPAQLALALDLPGGIALGAAAALWAAAGAYAASYLRDDTNRGRFSVFWLMALTGCLGVFVTADMVSFYLWLTLLSLGAYGLVVHDGTQRAQRAGAIYLGLALVAETLVVMAFVMLANATPDESILIADAARALATSPQRDLILGLLVVGFATKAGLAPMHFWIPLAHGAAPMPASAVLSGAVVVAGIMGLIRFVPFDTPLPGWGLVLAITGLFTAFYGVAVGMTQDNPKVVLAYSTVSQMGFIIAVLGMGLDAGDPTVTLAAAFYAAHHALVKGGLFLAVGVAMTTVNHRLWLIFVPAAVIALGLGGLPLTGGALAKYAVKAHFGDGVTAILATLSAAGTTALMTHFLFRLSKVEAKTAAASGLVLPWLALAFASILAPWALYLTVPVAATMKAMALAAIASALLAVLLGIALASALREQRLPRIPEGDIAFVVDDASYAGAIIARAFERTDAFLRRWEVACVSLLSLVVVFGVAFFAAAR